jgi:hypothetical protein
MLSLKKIADKISNVWKKIPQPIRDAIIDMIAKRMRREKK